MHYTDADVLIGLEKAREIAAGRNGEPAYAVFDKEIGSMYGGFSAVCSRCHAAEIAWHKDIGETGEAIQQAKNAYFKWLDMVTGSLPGADLVRWERGNATPDQIEVSLERMISVIEDNVEKLSFGQAALQELRPLQDLLDSELDQDREAVRRYRNSVAEKNGVKHSAKELFFRFRRFVRRDCGQESVEYGQLKDRAVRTTREEKLPAAAPEA
ncbi:MAG: hypothetical protein JW768_02325 [Chitinispirillaceae bacterium]|nr:hypothetical protein [Chitinispirillaceae bacterium]